MWTPAYAYLHTNSFVHTENVFRSALQNAGKLSELYPLHCYSVFRHRRPRPPCLTQNSAGLRWPRFPTTMLSFSWIIPSNISISGLIKPRSENIVQILVATFTLLALLPHSFYVHSILRDRWNLRLADPQVDDFPFSTLSIRIRIRIVLFGLITETYETSAKTIYLVAVAEATCDMVSSAFWIHKKERHNNAYHSRVKSMTFGSPLYLSFGCSQLKNFSVPDYRDNQCDESPLHAIRLFACSFTYCHLLELCKTCCPLSDIHFAVAGRVSGVVVDEGGHAVCLPSVTWNVVVNGGWSLMRGFTVVGKYSIAI